MKVLYAWEIGEDLGHITQFLPLALKLRQRGHGVVTALRELPRAEEIIGRHGFTMLQAPIWQGELLDPPQPPISYAEILFFFGYLDVSRLTAMIRAWTALISLVEPDIIIADHAPTALLAARALGIARTTMGAGFFLPPTTSPFPNMRPWLNVSPDRLMQSDQRVLRTINAALQTLSFPPLERVSDLFECAKHFLTTLPELDHYGVRKTTEYYGPILGPAGGAIPKWPEGRGPRVFAYLKSHYREMEEVLSSLDTFGCRTAAFIGGVSTQTIAGIQSNTISVSHRPYDIKRAAFECDFGVCHAGHGTICELLLEGKPLLLLPIHLEQHLVAARVSEAGAGIVVDYENSRKDFAAAIGKLVANPDFTERAKDFAQRHASFTSEATVSRIADDCELIARQGRET